MLSGEALRVTGQYLYPKTANDDELFCEYYTPRDVYDNASDDFVGTGRGHRVSKRPEPYFCDDCSGFDYDLCYRGARNAPEEERRDHNICWNSISRRDLICDPDEISEDNYSRLPDPLIRLPERQTSTCDTRVKKKLIDFHPEREQSVLSNFEELTLSAEDRLRKSRGPSRQKISEKGSGYVTISEWPQGFQNSSRMENIESVKQIKTDKDRLSPAKRYENDNNIYAERTEQGLNEGSPMLNPRGPEISSHLHREEADFVNVPRVESKYKHHKVRYYDGNHVDDIAYLDRSGNPHLENAETYRTNREYTKARVIPLQETSDCQRTRNNQGYSRDKDVRLRSRETNCTMF